MSKQRRRGPIRPSTINRIKKEIDEMLGEKGNDGNELLELAREQLAFWEALRKLGFPADDIYAAFYNGGELFTTLKADDKEWSVSISHTKKILPPEPYIEIYTNECNRWNTVMTTAERRKIFMKYMPVEKMVRVAISIRSKGINIPAMPNAPAAEDVAILQAYVEGRLVIVDGIPDHVQGMPN